MSTTIDGDTNVTRTTDRAHTALAVYREGGTWEAAAAAAGFASKSGAYRAAMALLRRHVNETATQLRQEANARHAQKIAMLEDVIYDLEQPLAERLRAVDAHTKAEARHARLNGLDLDVSPDQAPYDLRDRDLVHAVHLTQRTLRNAACGVPGADRQHRRLRQLRRGCRLASPLRPVAHLVGTVLLPRLPRQVGTVEAQRIVAGTVRGLLPFGTRAVPDLARDDVHTPPPTTDVHTPVAIPINAVRPHQTGVRHVSDVRHQVLQRTAILGHVRSSITGSDQDRGSDNCARSVHSTRDTGERT